MPRDSTILTANDPLRAYALPARITGTGEPMPLIATRIAVRVDGLLATVTTERVFHNAESRSIEATLTFPAPVHATLLALRAAIDGRTVVGTARRKAQARATYEAAIDDGRTAVLHEEVLRGVHMISVAHVPPGCDITVSGTWAMPLAYAGSLATLRIPVTVGDIYGRSPLPDSDDLMHGGLLQEADVSVACACGQARLAGWGPIRDRTARVCLDAPIDIEFEGLAPVLLQGVAADGRPVTLDIRSAPSGDGLIDAAIVSDRSGSMDEPASGAGGSGPSKLQIVHAALAEVATSLRRGDRAALWQFGDDGERITGRDFRGAVAAMTRTGGGTRIGRSLEQVLQSDESRDVLLITDGKSHDIDVQSLARSGRRFTVVLVGEDSLEAHVGQLAALTAGQLFVTSGDDAARAIRAAFDALRLPKAATPRIEGPPQHAEAIIGGMLVRATWGRSVGSQHGAAGDALVGPTRAVAAVAAGMAIARMDKDAAANLAEAEGIVCHLTSLVLVDEAGDVQESIPAQRKVATMLPRTAIPAAAPMPAARSRARPPQFADMPAPAPPIGLVSPAGGRQGGATGPFVDSPRMAPCMEAMFPSAPPPAAPRDPVRLAEFRGRIDWARDPEALRRGDFATLDRDLLAAVHETARQPTLSALAARLGIDVRVLVLALLARAEARNRNAARFARAILGRASAGELAAAAMAAGV